MLALKLQALERKTERQVFSFEELGIPFQASFAIDLRDKEILHFGTAEDGKPGCYLTTMARAMNGQEIQQYINEIFNK